MNQENLGPAERIIQALLTFTDHAVHNRPGYVVPDTSVACGVRWAPVTHKVEGQEKVVYRLDKVGKKTNKVRIGVLQANNSILENGRNIGTYRPAGLFPEVAAWMYGQIAEVWKLDNEFAARWASYAFGEEHRDLKVALAAFMLVQSRKGDPVMEDGKVAFHDEDFRDIGEAMLLWNRKDSKTDFNPKLLLRVYDFLMLPQVAEINRKLGFGRSARHAFLGRWNKAVEKWLAYREANPKLLQGLVKAGYRQTVMELARRVGYKPTETKFFELLRWKQAQAEDGRRSIAIGKEVAAAETWEGLTEEQICEKIVKERPGYKRIVGLLPAKMGVTRAIMAAAIEAKALSDKDLVIATPTLEELGLLEVQDIKDRWQKAVNAAEDMRAANIAQRVKSQAVKEKLDEGADKAAQKAVEEVVRGLMVHFIVDISGSMEGAIEAAKQHVAKFVQAFPLEQVRVSVFNTTGREIRIPHGSTVGVHNAFRGIVAGGGTHYAQGVAALSQYKPKDGEDLLMIFIGDEEDGHAHFAPSLRATGLNPMAFGLVRVFGKMSHKQGAAVRTTAQQLGIPCFQIDEKTFSDPYAIPRTIRTLVAATPVGAPIFGTTAPVRVSLVDKILKTDLLKKPPFAYATN